MTPKPIQSAPWQSRRLAAASAHLIDPELRQAVRTRDDGRCVLCGEPLQAVWECHHRKLRSRGGADEVTNLISLDSLCHKRVHGHPAWALEHGFMVSTYSDPAEQAVAVHLSAWRLPTPDGHWKDMP